MGAEILEDMSSAPKNHALFLEAEVHTTLGILNWGEEMASVLLWFFWNYKQKSWVCVSFQGEY